MFPRLIATDLDGTLLRDDATVAPRTRRALDAARARGAEVVVCTARPARWTVELGAAAGVTGPVVCANGAVVWDLGAAALLDAFPIAPEIADAVVRRLRAVVPEGAWAVEGVDGFGHEPVYEPRWPVGDDVVVADVETLLRDPPIKLLMRVATAEPDALAARARDAVSELVEITTSSQHDALLEMSAAGVSKGSGLAALCERRGIAREEVVAFGDMPNDLAMLAWAGRGVAMANAHHEVLAAADAVTLSNAQDGVAVAIEELLARG